MKEHAYVTNRSTHTETAVRVYWLIGDDIPEQFFSAKDPINAALDLLNIAHTTVSDGVVIPHEHLLPADLYPNMTTRRPEIYVNWCKPAPTPQLIIDAYRATAERYNEQRQPDEPAAEIPGDIHRADILSRRTKP